VAPLRSSQVPVEWVEELLLQSVLMVGYPRALIAFGVWRKFSGVPAPKEDEDTNYERWPEWARRGEETCRLVYGDNYRKLREHTRDLHPAIDAWMINEGYGRTLRARVLDLMRRELCTVAQTAGARGAAPAAFPSPRRAPRRRELRPDRGGALRRQPAAVVRSVEEGQGALADRARGVGTEQLMFIDRAVVRVVGGTGGSGACSFARFKFKPKAGPDGGDGGHGGSVFVRGDGNLTTLLDYRYKNVWKAERAEHGKGKNMTGRSTDDIYLPVPPGTLVFDVATGEPLGEILRPGDSILVARGGRGGRGNSRFATSTHQAPREWEPGEEARTARSSSSSSSSRMSAWSASPSRARAPS
jgi:Predicted GTPase